MSSDRVLVFWFEQEEAKTIHVGIVYIETQKHFFSTHSRFGEPLYSVLFSSEVTTQREDP